MNKEKESLAITPETIIKEKHLISKEALVRRAAAKKGLSLAQKKECYQSGEIARLHFSESFRGTLLNYGFEIVDRKEDNLMTISSKIAEGNPEFSDWWNIRKSVPPYFISPSVRFMISDYERGILLKPFIWFSETIVGPGNQLTHDRMARAVVAHYLGIPPIFKEIVKNDCKLIVFWEDINAAGARTIAQLFKEWARGNAIVENLSFSNVSPFCPPPERRFMTGNKDISGSYLPERFHGALFSQWREQLKIFKERLGVS